MLSLLAHSQQHGLGARPLLWRQGREILVEVGDRPAIDGVRQFFAQDFLHAPIDDRRRDGAGDVPKDQDRRLIGEFGHIAANDDAGVDFAAPHRQLQVLARTAAAGSRSEGEDRSTMRTRAVAKRRPSPDPAQPRSIAAVRPPFPKRSRRKSDRWRRARRRP